MSTTGRVAGILDADPKATAIVDVIGIGAGVYDKLRESGHRAEPFNASAGTRRKDASNEFGFTATRSAAWWNLRELLDLSRGAEVALPPDDELVGDLTAPHWRITSGAKIQVESKDDIRKRIGRSTDRADAVVQALWGSGVSWAEAYGRDAPSAPGARNCTWRARRRARRAGRPRSERHLSLRPRRSPSAAPRAGLKETQPHLTRGAEVYGKRGGR